jgi:hypothetical protein
MNFDWINSWKKRLQTKSFSRHRQQSDGDQIFIHIDMLLKGNFYNRPGGRVRQCAVTVDGATRLVTSGEWVDKSTYNALIQFDAIRPQEKEMDSRELA